MTTAYRAFAAAMKTSPAPRPRSGGYTDADYEKNRDEYLRRANSASMREQHQISFGRRK